MIKNIHSYIILVICVVIELNYSSPVTAAEQLQALSLLTLSQQLTDLSQEPSSLQHHMAFLQPSDLPSNVKIIDSSLNDEAPSAEHLAQLAAAGVSMIQPTVVWQNLSVGASIQALTGQDKNDLEAQSMASLSGYNEKQYAALVALYQLDGDLFETITPFPSDLLRQASLGGGDESCGYHAIANLQTMLEALNLPAHQRTKKLEQLMSLDRVNHLFASPGLTQELHLKPLWREYIQENNPTRRLADRNGEWLTDDGLRFLKQHVLPSVKHWQILEAQAKSAAHPEIEGRLNEDFPERSKPTAEKLIKAENFATFTLFEPTSRHWFDIIVLTEKGAAQIIILDSKNKPRYNYPAVGQIIRIVCSKIGKTPPPTLTTLLAPVTVRSEEDKRKAARKTNLMSLAQAGNLDLFLDVTELTDEEMELIEARAKTSFYESPSWRPQLIARAYLEKDPLKQQQLFKKFKPPLTDAEKQLWTGS